MHPEDIKPGMRIVMTGIKGEVREPVLDYTAAWQTIGDFRLFSSLGGMPLTVLAVQFPFVIVCYRSPETQFNFLTCAATASSVERPLDLRRFNFERCKIWYGQQLKPVAGNQPKRRRKRT